MSLSKLKRIEKGLNLTDNQKISDLMLARRKIRGGYMEDLTMREHLAYSIDQQTKEKMEGKKIMPRIRL